MSLLIKALERAARNRNKAETGGHTSAPAASRIEPALEAAPLQPTPNVAIPALEPLSPRSTTHCAAPQHRDTVERSSQQPESADGLTAAPRAARSAAGMANLDTQHQHTHSTDSGSLMPDVRLFVQTYPLATIGALAVLLGAAFGVYVYLQTAQPAQIKALKPILHTPLSPTPSARPPDAGRLDAAAPVPNASQSLMPSSAPEGLDTAPAISTAAVLGTTAPQRESGAILDRSSASDKPRIARADALEASTPNAGGSLKVSTEPVRMREMIKVLPTAREARSNPELSQAYSALQAGDFESARNLYARVIQGDPLNTDALLGLAYIATHDTRTEDAVKLYMRILQVHPSHAAAQAALIGIIGKGDPLLAESRVKQLISREPSAFLHFVLGNVYADQSLWSQAQLSYFQAHHLEPSNADYAYNLAIGLDHLRQSKVALNFYRRAEELAATHRRAHFNLTRVRERITALAMQVE